MGFHASAVLATPPPTAELDRLGDEIAELSAHLDAATARLLTLIREFDARGGWNTGFRSCAAWLGWRVGLEQGRGPGAGPCRARPRETATPVRGPGPRRAVLRQGPCAHAGGHAGDRSAPARGGPRGHGRACRTHRAGLAARGSPGRGAEGRPSARRAGAPGLRGRRTGWWWCGDGSRRRRGRSCGARWRPGARCSIRRRAGRKARQAPRHGAAEPEAERPTLTQQQADALALVAESALHHALDPGAPADPRSSSMPPGRPGRSGSPGPVDSRGRRARSRGNVSSPRAKCGEPSRDAAGVVIGVNHFACAGRSSISRPGLSLPGAAGVVAPPRALGAGGPTTLSNLAPLCGGIIARCTRRAIRLRTGLMGRSSSGRTRMAARSRRCRYRLG